MADTAGEMKALAEAFELFTRTTKTMEESYRCLQERLRDLDQELAVKNRELAFTNDYLNYILESMSDGVIAIDTKGVITKFNVAAGNVLGYEAAEVVGRPFAEVFGREFSPVSGASTLKLFAKSGREVTVSERDAPVADRANRRLGKVKVFQDLSEILALREQVRQMDRLAAIGEMAATVAHEIRNPLGGIRGFASLLARDLEPSDPRARLVEKILAGAHNLDKVVNELLEYTRPVSLALRPVACTDIIESAIAYLDSSRPRVQIKNEVAGGMRVLADHDKMRQVILNMLLNAVQSIEDEGEVVVSAVVETDTIAVHIRDTGCGMTPEQAGKIFSPFYTTKEKGTGLGLAIAAKIVEGHGARLEVESEPGRGSTFTIWLARTE